MIVLDTNALLWVHWDSPRLGPIARDEISGAETVYYSSVSVLEIVIKNMLGKLELPGSEKFPGVFTEAGMTELVLSAEHADAMRADTSLVHHDPFDRMLLGQARAEGLTLITSDGTLNDLRLDFVLNARA
ncbi:type II toxin-antitoxin system VapC family toxin [Nesterenkonia ebinurensis]|uniref:type II toxin-antitoxin system VapC family toxin n=1 Tax=Nesterenkonia ebinurensis TaxID=2608252 RepID=UPI00123CB06C|nr:type II toxin-antitoxin system VapC family toxin [Nesterenkonia ebinurensis]